MKLREEVRIGGRVKRIYDNPQTPYARVLDSQNVSEEDKAELREAYSYPNLLGLRWGINELQDRLLDPLS